MLEHRKRIDPAIQNKVWEFPRRRDQTGLFIMLVEALETIPAKVHLCECGLKKLSSAVTDQQGFTQTSLLFESPPAGIRKNAPQYRLRLLVALFPCSVSTASALFETQVCSGCVSSLLIGCVMFWGRLPSVLRSSTKNSFIKNDKTTWMMIIFTFWYRTTGFHCSG